MYQFRESTVQICAHNGHPGVGPQITREIRELRRRSEAVQVSLLAPWTVMRNPRELQVLLQTGKCHGNDAQEVVGCLATAGRVGLTGGDSVATEQGAGDPDYVGVKVWIASGE